MTGKRPRALTRTASVSQLGSGNFSQEFSPLLENPKERLKPTMKESLSPSCAGGPRVVIGFDPKPSAHGISINECSATLSPKSGPCSPSFHDKASSPRSVLNSLFSRQRCVKPSDGVGLGIALHAPTLATADYDTKSNLTESTIEGDHIAIPVRDENTPPHTHETSGASQSRPQSHPIPTPGISPCRFTTQASAHQQCVTENNKKLPTSSTRNGSHQPVARPAPGWFEQGALKVDRRDTFLLGASPVMSVRGGDVPAALTASSHFLDECSFCKRQIAADKDIFMYRGDKAFCSVECRSQQMLMDERSHNCASSALRHGSVVPSRRTCVGPASPVAAA